METTTASCEMCKREFEVRFRYQIRDEGGRFVHICSVSCQQTYLSGQDGVCKCDTCGNSFSFEFPYQVAVRDGSKNFYCTTECRETGESRPSSVEVVGQAPRRIAVFNHKGGTGKTTTAINLAAGLAEAGHKVLLIDADGQGNVGASLGIRGQRTLYHVLVHGVPAEEVAVPVRNRLDVLTSNELLAAAELYLAERPNRDRILRERLGNVGADYDVVVLDCAPALSLMNQNAMVYADSIIVPVACDYLSLIGVKQVLRTMRNVRELLQHNVELLGVLPTFFDIRNRISRDSLTTLRNHFEGRCYEPIRINTRLREAPSARQSIFEFAPNSHGAADYMQLVQRLVQMHTAETSTDGQALLEAG